MNQSRRKVTMGAAAALGGALLAGMMAPGRLFAEWNGQAFDARRLDDAMRALGVSGAQRSGGIVILAPDVAENGMSVPVNIESRIAGTRSISVFVDRNPFPHIARFELSAQALPVVALRLKAAESSPVRVVVQAAQSYHVAAKEVKVTAGGCGDPALTGDGEPAPARIGPTKIRARLAGAVVDLRALLAHPMENGLRKDRTGKAIPEHFIKELDVQLNGKTVIAAHLGRSVSANSLFAFRIRGAGANDRVTISWRDSRGLKRTDEAVVGA